MQQIPEIDQNEIEIKKIMKYRTDELKIVDKDAPAKFLEVSNFLPGKFHPTMAIDDVDDDFDF